MNNKFLNAIIAVSLLTPVVIPVVLVVETIRRPAAVEPEKSAPEVALVESAADQSAREYAQRLAALCRQQSEKANDFKSYAELFDFGHAGEIEARHAFEAFEDQLTKTINPAEPYKPAAVRQAFAEAARGFDRAAGLTQKEGK